MSGIQNTMMGDQITVLEIVMDDTYLTVVISEMLCSDDTMKVSLHQLLDDCCWIAISKINDEESQRERTIDFCEVINGWGLDDIEN